MTVVPPAHLGVAAVHTTASPLHWRELQWLADERGLRLAPDGMYEGGAPVVTSDDVAVYRAVGLQPVPAEQRDGTDELALARRGELPSCADVDDIQG